MRKAMLSSLWLSVAALAACSANNGAGATPDSGAGGSADGGSLVDGHGGGPCSNLGTRPLSASAAPVGRKLATGDNLSVRAVTTDGYVIYSDDVAMQLHAVNLSGGASHDLGKLGPKFWISSIGNVVFAWSNVTSADVGALNVWTAQTGVHQVSTGSFGLLAGVSQDGGKILYVDGVDASGTTGDVSIAAVDGSGSSKLVAGAHVSGCFPQLGFVGAYAVASYCESAPTNDPSATISSFALAGLRRTDLVTHAANYWSSSTTGMDLLLSTKGGVMRVAVSGGPAHTIDPAGFIAQMSGDGRTAFYSTMNHGFRRSSLESPAPVTLVQSDFGGLYTLSRDDGWALYYWNMGSSGSDLYLASTASAAHPMTLSSAKTAGLAGDGFTSDSSHAVYVAEVDPCTNAGTLNALAVGESKPVVLAQGAWSDWATGGANIVMTTNFASTGGLRYGRADVEYVNTSKTNKPTRLVERADAVIGLSPAGDELVYSWSARAGSTAGVYALTLPQL